MNRRELLKRGFELGAAGLLLPMVEPIRRYWSLDRTMVPAPAIETGWFDTNMPLPFRKVYQGPVVIEDGWMWEERDIFVTDSSTLSPKSLIYIGAEPMWVRSVDGSKVTVATARHRIPYAASS